MKKLIVLALCLFSVPVLAQEPEKFDAQKFIDSLNFQTGNINLPNDVASLKLPKGYVYLSPDDAQKLLVQGWGNPPGKKGLGMILPADRNPFSPNSWAVTINYIEDGYVSDKDARKIDYGELLQQMKDEAAQDSRERVKQGYDSIQLIGWAANPHYNADTKKLYWAKEYKFGNDKVDTLNYDIRMLGRKGVLEMNFIAGMDQLPEINQRLDDVLSMAEFNRGMRYSDFDPSIDKVAAYGIGALVAGTLAAKTGLFTVALVLLKKFGVIALVFLAGLYRKVFRRKKTEVSESAGDA